MTALRERKGGMATDAQDEARFARHRRDMLEAQIRRRGVRDPRVLEAMGRIPRERFVPPAERGLEYDDRALPIDCGQTISQPYIVAYMTERLNVEATSRVLEIGTGSGYQTAILAALAADVYTIERIQALQGQARDHLADLNVHNVFFRCGDGTLGWPEAAPFDRILVTAAAPKVPQPLIDQLTDGGMLVAPVGGARGQTLVRVTRRGDRATERQLIACRFVRLIGEAGWRSGE